MRYSELIRSTCLWLLLLLNSGIAAAFTPFVVDEIRVDGLERISVGTVYNYLPVEPGQLFSEDKTVIALRKLYQTGFFDDVTLEQDGNVLVVSVVERPSIAKISIEGNSDIDTEQLLSGLKLSGFMEGRSLNRSLLDRVTVELKQQYMALGKYNVRVTPKQIPLPRNRVEVVLQIDEGKEASINRIKLLGSVAYSWDDLAYLFTLSQPTLFSYLGDSTQYSSQKLIGDSENLRSFYMDRGYINFAIDSTQVSITPQKEDVYVTINITEGKQYRIRNIEIVGDTIIPKEKLRALILLQNGDLFSRSKVSSGSESIAEMLGDNGYAFANVNPIPQIHDDALEVSLKYYVDPGSRVYVRRINLSGNHRTKDEVLRRELRQMEAAWISTEKIKRSRVRLNRLGYFEEVSVNSPPVMGTADQVDVDIKVTEKDAFGTLSAGLGYSSADGVVVNASVTQDNFLGSGNSFTARVDRSSVNEVYSFSFTEPYITTSGISRTYRIAYRKTDTADTDTSNYTTDNYLFGVSFAIPISEYNTVSSGFTYEHTNLKSNNYTSNEVLAFCTDVATIADCSYDTYIWSNSFAYDSRNRRLFPTKGILSQVAVDLAFPLGSESLSFYKSEFTQRNHIEIQDEVSLQLQARIGYAGSYGSTKDLPPYERYHAGGVNSVRGYRTNTLVTTGTVDSKGESYGGDTRILANAELFFPPPFESQSKSMRFGLFIDAGNVYVRSNGIDTADLRYSAGLSLLWMTPVGPLKFSFAKGLNDKPTDELETFQFTIGIQ